MVVIDGSMKFIERLRELEAEATSELWYYGTNGCEDGIIFDKDFNSIGTSFRNVVDAELIVTLRNCVHELLAVVKAAEDLAYYCVDLQAARLIKEPTMINELTCNCTEALTALEAKVGKE